MHICIYALHALEWKGQEAVWEKQAKEKKKRKEKCEKEKEKKKNKDSTIPITQQSILFSKRTGQCSPAPSLMDRIRFWFMLRDSLQCQAGPSVFHGNVSAGPLLISARTAARL